MISHMTNNKFTYKSVVVSTRLVRGNKGKYTEYTAQLRVINKPDQIGTSFATIRESSLDRMKKAINDELNLNGTIVNEQGHVVRNYELAFGLN